MKRIVVGLEYAGDAFCGWQSQAHGRTVQDVLERALAQIAGEPVRTHCAGRTDTGVHASAQVAHFDTRAVRPASAWVRGVNALLPPAVVVRWATEVTDDFHARFLACERQYRYILHNAPTRPAMLAGRVGWYHPPLDVARMAAAAECLVGTHDFSSFRAAGCQAKTPVRVMREARVTRQGEYLLFDFRANGFLHHMIRNLMGCLVAVGQGLQPPEWISTVLAARSRDAAAPTFSPDGLYFLGPRYDARWGLPERTAAYDWLP